MRGRQPCPARRRWQRSPARRRRRQTLALLVFLDLQGGAPVLEMRLLLPGLHDVEVLQMRLLLWRTRGSSSCRATSTSSSSVQIRSDFIFVPLCALIVCFASEMLRKTCSCSACVLCFRLCALMIISVLHFVVKIDLG